MRGRLLWGVGLLLGLGMAAFLLALRATSTNWTKDATYVFSDRQDAELEYLYVLRYQEAVVQIAVFPGYAGRRWYHCPKFPMDLLRQEQMGAVRAGDITPPFEPEGPWFCRITLTSDQARKRGEAWFRNDNQEVEQWFRSLRHALVRDEYRVETLPSWVERDERSKRYFGL